MRSAINYTADNADRVISIHDSINQIAIYIDAGACGSEVLRSGCAERKY